MDSQIHSSTPMDDVIPEIDLRHMSRDLSKATYGIESSSASKEHIKNVVVLAQKLVQTTNSPKIDQAHRVAACNLLCALIESCIKSPSPGFHLILWERGIWTQAFEIYLQQCQTAKPKSMRQLLVTLTAALRKSTYSEATQAVKHDALARISPIVFDGTDQTLFKPSLQVLNQLLLKNVYDIDELLQIYNTARPTRYPKDIGGLLENLFDSMHDGDFGSSISQFVSVILDRYDGAPEVPDLPASEREGGLPVWAWPLSRSIASRSGELNSFRLYLFPVLFNRSATHYKAFLESLGLAQVFGHSSDSRADFSDNLPIDKAILFAALQAGKESGLVEEVESISASSAEARALHLPVNRIRRLLDHSSNEARLAGLSLLVTSHSVTRPIPESTFKTLRRHLQSFHADTDAKSRGELFSLTQRLVDRLRATSATLARTSTARIGVQQRSALSSTSTADNAQRTLERHKQFMEWYIRFLHWELRPTASYQRHISALRCLSILAASGLDCAVPKEALSKAAHGETRWPFHLTVINIETEQLLLDLIVDPFDDARQGSAALLLLNAGSATGSSANSHRERLLRTLRRAEKTMLASGRADHADGVAHLYHVLYAQGRSNHDKEDSWWISRDKVVSRLVEKVEEMMEVANVSHALAISKYPLHGLFASLRYILGSGDFYAQIVSSAEFPSWQALHARIITCIEGIWTIVHDVLCNDAPEGHLPEDMAQDSDISTKDALSYSWRALKESSSLLATIVSKAPLDTGPSFMFTVADLQRLTDLSFAQLAELRHRGAFSNVAQSYAACCMRYNDKAIPSGSDKLQCCYKKALLYVSNKSTINTRRSAGIPSLVCGVLIADRSTELLGQAIQDLSKIALQNVGLELAQDGGLPQVHALNCLKDIFKNTRLGEHSAPHISSAMIIAAECLSSDVWAIRNCGLMLFRALIDRLLGTNDAYTDEYVSSGAQLSLKQYPELSNVLMQQLTTPDLDSLDAGKLFNSDTSDTRGEGVFPALQLLQRTYIPKDMHGAFQQAVRRLMSSRTWHIRDKAARTYASMIQDQSTEKLEELLNTSESDQNLLHGSLLCAKYLLRLVIRQFGVGPALEQVLSALRQASEIYRRNQCPFTKAAYVDVLETCSRLSTACSGTLGKCMPIDLLAELGKVTTAPLYCQPGAAALRKSLACAVCQHLTNRTESPEHEYDDICSAITDLAHIDADACCAFLEQAEVNFEYQSDLHPQIGNVCIELCVDILCRHVENNQVKPAAQRLLLALIDPENLSEDRMSATKGFVSIYSAIQGPVTIHGGQTYADRWIQLQAAAIDYRLSFTGDFNDELLEEIDHLLTDASLTLVGSSMNSREASVGALARLPRLCTAMFNLEPLPVQCLHLCLVTYDYLNDDDEDIRETATKVICRILYAGNSRNDQDMIPLVASERLLALICKRWPLAPEVVETAMSRAFRVHSTLTRSVHDQLLKSAEEDNSLFAEEKQNLYIDEAREARVWSQMLMRLSAEAVSKPLQRALAVWTMDGLNELTAEANARVGGPLGWSSKPEVFVLGLRVVFAAEVLLHLRDGGIGVPVRGSVIRSKLRELADAGERNEMHPLWLRAIRKTLETSVTAKLRRIQLVLGAVERRLTSAWSGKR